MALNFDAFKKILPDQIGAVPEENKLDFSAFEKIAPAAPKKISAFAKIAGAPAGGIMSLDMTGEPSLFKPEKIDPVTTPAFIPVDPENKPTIRLPFGTKGQNVPDAVAGIFPANIAVDMAFRTMEIIPKALVQMNQNISAAGRSLIGKEEVPTITHKQTLERLGFSGPLESTGQKLITRFNERVKQSPPSTTADVGKQALFSALETVVPDAFDIIFAGDTAALGALGTLKATKFDPAVDGALNRLGLSDNFTQEALRNNFVNAARNIAKTADVTAARQLMQDVATIGEALYGKGINQAKGLARFAQDISKKMIQPFGEAPIPRYDISGKPETQLPGMATVGEPQPSFGLSTKPVTRVGGAPEPLKPTDLSKAETGKSITIQGFAGMKKGGVDSGFRTPDRNLAESYAKTRGGDIQEFEDTLENPYVAPHQAAVLSELSQQGDSTAKDIVEQYSKILAERKGTNNQDEIVRKIDSYIAEVLQAKGYDSVIYPYVNEYQVFKKPIEAGKDIFPSAKRDIFSGMTEEERQMYLDAVNETTMLEGEIRNQFNRFLDAVKSIRGAADREILGSGDIEQVKKLLVSKGVNTKGLFDTTGDITQTDDEVLDLIRSRIQATQPELLYGKEATKALSIGGEARAAKQILARQKAIEKIVSRMTARQKKALDANFKKKLAEIKRIVPPSEKIVKTEKSLLNERFRNQARGAKAAFMSTLRRVRDRDTKIRTMRRFFNLDENDVRKALEGKDYKIMTEENFNAFMDRLYERAQSHIERSVALTNLRSTLMEGDFKKWENLQAAMKLPSLSKMTTEQLRQFDKALQEFKTGDEFLTVRQIETVDSTDLKGIRTMREARARLAEAMGVKPGEFSGVTVSEFDRYRWDTALAERNPFYKLVVERVGKSLLNAEAAVMKMEDEINRLFNAARKSRGTAERIKSAFIPMDERIFKYLEANPAGKMELAIGMTKEELAAAEYVRARYKEMYDLLVQKEALKKMGYRENYVTHIRRGFLEAWRDDSLKTALTEFLAKRRQEEAIFTILDQKTGEVLPLEKFFQFSLPRTGGIVPTKNVPRAFLSYARAFQKKAALDSVVPEIMIYTAAITPKGMTPRGLEMDTSLKTFLTEWLNTKKGRTAKMLVKQGGKLDGMLRAAQAFTYLHDLALNIPLGIGSQAGEQTLTFITIGPVRYALGAARLMTKRGRLIAAKYNNFVGRSPWDALHDASKSLQDKVYEGMFGLFKDATIRANKIALLGSLTEKEMSSGIVDPARLAALQTELGRYRVVDNATSIIGATTEGRIGSQYKRWAIAPMRTVMKNLIELIGMIKNGKTPANTRAANELFRSTIVIALASLAAYEMADDDKKDDSFLTAVAKKAVQDAYSILSSIDPQTLTSVPRLMTFVSELFAAISNTIRLAEYEDGTLKGPKQAKRIIVPNVVRQISPSEKKSSGGPSLPSLPALPSLPQLPSLPELPALPSL